MITRQLLAAVAPGRRVYTNCCPGDRLQTRAQSAPPTATSACDSHAGFGPPTGSFEDCAADLWPTGSQVHLHAARQEACGPELDGSASAVSTGDPSVPLAGCGGGAVLCPLPSLLSGEPFLELGPCSQELGSLCVLPHQPSSQLSSLDLPGGPLRTLNAATVGASCPGRVRPRDVDGSLDAAFACHAAFQT